MIWKVLLNNYHECLINTKIMLVLSTTISLLAYLDIINPLSISLSPYHIFRKFQFYRLIFCTFYFPAKNLDTIISILFLQKYSFMLETEFSNSLDFFWILISINFFVLLFSIFFKVSYTCYSFSCAITYLWTKINPNVSVQVMGFIVFPAFYLPFLLPIIGFFSDGKFPKKEIVGVLAGHFVYFFKLVYPKCSSFKTVCRDFLDDVTKKIYGARNRVVNVGISMSDGNLVITNNNSNNSENLNNENLNNEGLNNENEKESNSTDSENSNSTDSQKIDNRFSGKKIFNFNNINKDEINDSTSTESSSDE